MIRINERLQRMRDEEGFTLIESMVVVLIIAILIAIAIPTFLGARRRAQDRAAQSSGRNAVTAAKAIFTDNEDYANATQTALEESEPALEFTTGSSSDQNQVSFTSMKEGTSAGTKHNRFVAAVLSETQTCWYVHDLTARITGAEANAGTRWAKEDDAASCAFGGAPDYDSTSWVKRPGSAVSI